MPSTTRARDRRIGQIALDELDAVPRMLRS